MTEPQPKPRSTVGDKVVWVIIVFIVIGGAIWALKPAKPWDHRCKDGWVTKSDGPGTCSWHGGEDR